MENQITTWYLELIDRNDFKPKYLNDPALQIVEVQIKDFRYNRFLYSLVGEQWNWNDKLKWSDDEWQAYAEHEDLSTYVAYHKGTPAGYFELRKEPPYDVKIEYFGLSSRFIGKGFGGHLLSNAIDTAWELKAKRIWVHTCSNDHPSALRNYQARGMKVYDTKVEN